MPYSLIAVWKWIVCVTQGKPVEDSGYRLGLGVIGLLAVVMLSAAPLLSPSIQVPRSSFQNETAEDSQIDREE